jgi:hypothetical protein
MHNGMSIQSSHTCDLLLTDLTPQARKSHILPGLAHSSLIYVEQLCDNGCNIKFKKEAVSVMKSGKCVILGSRDIVYTFASELKQGEHQKFFTPSLKSKL